ncbi:MAG: GntP family permease [Planctomycetaceae bacterium]|nr:GntP family permease [Planctomycetaceae bacterium]
MLTLAILSTGLIIVVGGILALRLPAFVALILAGLTVGLLTPSRLIERAAVLEKAAPVKQLSAETQTLQHSQNLEAGPFTLLADAGSETPLQILGDIDLLPVDDAPVADPAGATVDSKWISRRFEIPGQPSVPVAEWSQTARTFWLVSPSVAASAVQDSQKFFMVRLTSALGEYCGSLAIMIVAASIIGRCLLDSGAASCIVNSTLKVVGEQLAPAAFVVSGFVLGIPVFFDTVFYLMIPLGKALRLRTGGNYLLYVLSIVAGGTMAHSLVPPTPGPLFIASEFQVSMPTMMIGGTAVGLFAAAVGMLYAVWVNRRCELPLRDMPETPTTDTAEDQRQPELWAALLPILLPVVLISLGALLSKSADGEHLFAGVTIGASLAAVIKSLSDRNLALLISAATAVAVLVQTKRPSRQKLADALHHAVTSAGTIILVTAAGGAFGRMMRQTSVAELLQNLPDTSPALVVIAAFFVTTAVRTAQGSATVAMFTAAGIFGGIVTSGAAGVDPLYVALAVGCGSKPVAWMNDSGFWVITRMSGMTEAEGLRYVSPMTGIAGLAGLVAILISMTLFPQNPVDQLLNSFSAS